MSRNAVRCNRHKPGRQNMGVQITQSGLTVAGETASDELTYLDSAGGARKHQYRSQGYLSSELELGPRELRSYQTADQSPLLIVICFGEQSANLTV